MKIDGNQLGGVAPEPNLQKPGQASGGLPQAGGTEGARRAAKLGYENTADLAAESDSAAASDQVALSGLGQELSRLVNADADRDKRIEKLASDYSAGRLDVDAGKVAAKMVDDAFHSE